ncbi:FecR family protein [Dyella agri]|uniref:FecR domain-containing protein n=1 Tax=Dyella agri TaxID=1926869 RepID=A0ABW8KEJ5_9GAMM
MDKEFGQHESTSGRPGDAEHWFARLLEPGCSDAESVAFQRWHDADPAHAAAWREVNALWRQSADAVRSPALAAAAWRALREQPATPWYRRTRVLLPAVAALATAAVAVLVVLPRWRTASPPSDTVVYQTTTGQPRSVRLADGTLVILDAQSSLQVRYGEHFRHADLLRGRAQFAVRHDPQRPFEVHAGNGTITDVGTVFQVRTDDECTGVILLKGAVNVSVAAPGHAVAQVSLLHGNRQVWFSRDGSISPPQPADTQAAEGWTQGKLVVHDWRLPDLLSEMNRYNQTQVAIGDPSLNALRVSGVFDANDPETMLQMLQQGWPVHARRIDGTRVLLVPLAGQTELPRKR